MTLASDYGPGMGYVLNIFSHSLVIVNFITQKVKNKAANLTTNLFSFPQFSSGSQNHAMLGIFHFIFYDKSACFFSSRHCQCLPPKFPDNCQGKDDHTCTHNKQCGKYGLCTKFYGRVGKK